MNTIDELIAKADAYLASADKYVLVPIEPADAMCKVGAHVNSEWLNDNAPIGEQRFRDPAKVLAADEWAKMVELAIAIDHDPQTPDFRRARLRELFANEMGAQA